MESTVTSKIKIVNKLLIKQFGIPCRNLKLPNPVDLLIATILSQNTNDNNSYKAYQNLRKKFLNWESVASATRPSIEKEIKVAGLGLQKSKAIKNFLMRIQKRQNKIDLDFLNNLSNNEIITELTNFDGIGVKTASCVLLFALDRNICPVDTHVHRTTNRIGIVKTSTPDKTFFILNKDFPAKIAHQFHTNLIRLGREVCKSQNPNCRSCLLIKICEYEHKDFMRKNSTKKNDFMLLDNINI
ncbi:MAG: endonuclease III [bacterium]